MRTILIALIAGAILSITASAQLHQTKLFIDDGSGNFSIFTYTVPQGVAITGAGLSLTATTPLITIPTYNVVGSVASILTIQEANGNPLVTIAETSTTTDTMLVQGDIAATGNLIAANGFVTPDIGANGSLGPGTIALGDNSGTSGQIVFSDGSTDATHNYFGDINPPTAFTADRTYTLPDANGTFALQSSSNLPIVHAHGAYTLSGNTNMYELTGTPGSDEGVNLPTASGSPGQVMYILNSTNNSQTIGGIPTASTTGIAFGNFPTFGWKKLFTF